MPQSALPHDDGRRTVALVGLMATGKSTIGQILASRLDRPLLDNDEMLVERRGATAADLGQRLGLDAMHAFESQILDEQLAVPHPSVITVAAHPLIDPGSRRRLHRLAVVIWLRADPAVLAARIAAGAARPAVTGAAKPTADAIVALAHERKAAFEDVADIIVDSTTETPTRISHRIIDALGAFGIESSAG